MILIDETRRKPAPAEFAEIAFSLRDTIFRYSHNSGVGAYAEDIEGFEKPFFMQLIASTKQT